MARPGMHSAGVPGPPVQGTRGAGGEHPGRGPRARRRRWPRSVAERRGRAADPRPRPRDRKTAFGVPARTVRRSVAPAPAPPRGTRSGTCASQPVG